MIHVFTTSNADGWTRYGRRMVETWRKNWPIDAKLTYYCEPGEFDKSDERVEFKPLDFPLLTEWRKINAKHNGRRRGQYDFGKDAQRFAPKAYVISHVLETSEPGMHIWMDADTYTHAPVSEEYLKAKLGNSFCAYLGREGFYTETGCLIFDTSHHYARDFGAAFWGVYQQNKIFEFPYWVDCEAFDYCRKQFEGSLSFKNMSPRKIKIGHPFIDVFGDTMDHLKGPNRKAKGISPELRKRGEKSDVNLTTFRRSERYRVPGRR